MQILDIVLYGENEKKRIVSFDLGKVNIITGDSKTGKTTIIDIVDYCLGSGDFKIAEGVVRECVLWYAVRFQLKHGQQVFIARPNQSKSKYWGSKSDVYFLQKDKINIPNFNELVANTNSSILVQKLGNLIGIEEYTHKPEAFTRNETPVSFKHSRYYCFQPQTDIDQRDFLFYHQKKETWTEQAIKDTLPYFLGAVGSESVMLSQRLAEKKRNLNRLEREMREFQLIVEKTIGKSLGLVYEAKQVGLLPLNFIAKDTQESLSVLKELAEKNILTEDKTPLGNEVLIELQANRQALVEKRSHIWENIKTAEDYQKEGQGYGNEAAQQINRLESINIFSKHKHANEMECPLCNQELKNPIPTIKDMNNLLTSLSNNLEITRKEQPRLLEYIGKLQKEKTELNSSIIEIENAIKKVYQEQEQAQRIKDLNIRRGMILGRISLYLESKVEVSESSDSKQKIDKLKTEIDELEKMLSNEAKEEKLQNILNLLSSWMTLWSKELEMEFKDRTINFDIKHLTLLMNSLEGTIRLNQTGSGENWVSYHLLIHFALHRYFVLKNRPVPNFLILDQLSQAYFPPEKDLEGTGNIDQSEDDKAINRLFEFIFNRTNELEGDFQVIIIDHAKLNEAKFKEAIKEEWRNGIKLVPIDWVLEKN